MLTPLELYQGNLCRTLKPEDAQICLSVAAAQALDAVGIGNHTFLKIRNPSGTGEVVRYDHTTDWSDRRGQAVLCVPVVRDVLQTGRKGFAPGACVQFVWTAEAISEVAGE